MGKKQFKVIVIGAGGRGASYTNIMHEVPEMFKVVGVAEPIEDRRNYIKEKHNISDEFCFDSWEKILNVPKFADIAIIATMDRMHTEPVIKAMELGYDLLLEKPVAPTPEECAAIANRAKELGRKIMVCHVLRYTPFFKTLKKLINDGIVGDVVNIEHTEGVGNKHQSHSFVRGNWGNEERSSFMLLQKCCHDLDILQWLLDKDCKKIQSFGSLKHFRRENAPEGSPERCIDGCPVSEKCFYNAMKLYYDAKGNYWFRRAATCKPAGKDTDCEVLKALRDTQYGKCVYKCDNNVVDHQTVNMEFEGGTTIAMTMSAFTRGGRRIRVMGTKGELVCNMSLPANEAFEFYDFATDKAACLDIDYSKVGDSIVDGHGGGDSGIIADLYKYMTDEIDASDVSEIAISTKNHMLAFAAEASRKTNTVVDVEAYMKKYMN
ncbi:MAG: Gfo/Idh/MocA family oxidoreductase [Acutalibacteraceae bacterium]|nr:Gfo/Idh/MocA family oxidoreductase [Acutalibacteraceae bacterium]